jgi:pilus assembly protein Flp/PilA
MFLSRSFLSLRSGSCLERLFRDRRAVTSIEYVIIALLIIFAIFGGLSKIGPQLTSSFNHVSSEL